MARPSTFVRVLAVASLWLSACSQPGSDGAGGAAGSAVPGSSNPASTAPGGISLEEARATGADVTETAPRVEGGGRANAGPGQSVPASFTITNLGTQDATFVLTLIAPPGWRVEPALLADLRLAPRAREVVSILVTVPQTSPAGPSEVRLRAHSRTSPLLEDDAAFTLVVA